jgi:predicted metal-dependent HD superfamily phosphohydrolase
MATAETGLSRFQSLWRRNLIEAATDDSVEIYRNLLQRYREPERHYHSIEHIEHCLNQFDQCKSLADNADALELAIWFHDAILVSGRRDNEARSAELYLELTHDVQTESTRQLVNRLIMATLHDGSSLNDTDSCLMVDIDLSSFGLPWEEFLRDSFNLRAENPQLSDNDYFLNQTGFQRSLLARPRFFQSDYFHDRLEAQARENLERYFEYIDNQD